MSLMRIYNDPFLRFLAESSQVENQKKNNCYCTPSANIVEDKDAFRIEMAIPGYSREEVSISIEKDVLTISSVKKEEEKAEEVNYTRKEFSRYDFSRSFRLSDAINQDQVQAEFKNGLLSIVLPKKEEVKIRKEIAIA